MRFFEEKKILRPVNFQSERLIIGIFVPLFIASFFLPAFVRSYFIRTLTEFYFYLVMTSCFSLLGGRTGHLNLGQGVFVGIGAYGTGICIRAGIPCWGAIIIASSIGISWGFLLAPLLFRLKGAAFAMVNLALLFIFLAASMRFRNLTGGVDGLFLNSPSKLFFAFYGQCFLAFAVIFATILIPRSRIGYQTLILGQDSFLAESIGIPTLRIKVKLYVFCATVLSASGGFFMLGEGYLVPSTVFGLQMSLLPVVMAMVGGLGNTLGALWGTLIVFGIREWLWVYVGSMEQTLLGLMLILAGKRKAIFQYTRKLFP